MSLQPRRLQGAEASFDLFRSLVYLGRELIFTNDRTSRANRRRLALAARERDLSEVHRKRGAALFA
jgi:hypothetical protein